MANKPINFAMLCFPVGIETKLDKTGLTWYHWHDVRHHSNLPSISVERAFVGNHFQHLRGDGRGIHATVFFYGGLKVAIFNPG